MLVRSLELQKVSNNLSENFKFYLQVITSSLIKIIMQLLNHNCTFMIRNKDLVSSSELRRIWSKTEEKGL